MPRLLWPVLLSAIGAACHAPAPGVGVLLPRQLSARDFPGAAAIVSGFDALATLPSEWRVGDEVLYGLRLRRGDSARHWLLHLRVTEPVAIAREGDEVPAGEPLPPLEWSIRINGDPQSFRSRRCRITATVHDAAGKVLGESSPQLPRDFLERGFVPACNVVADRLAKHPETRNTDAFYAGLDVRPLSEATVCAIALLQVVQEDEVLAPILWEVVQTPSIWSIAGNLFSVRVVVRPRFHAAAEIPSPVPAAGPDTAWRVPVSLLVNETPALHADLVVGPSSSPLALCGGVIGASATHPAQPDVDFSFVLLGARRGGGNGGAGAAPHRSTANGRAVALARR